MLHLGVPLIARGSLSLDGGGVRSATIGGGGCLSQTQSLVGGFAPESDRTG